MKRSKPTIHDIAERAEVSKSTVSLVFLNRPGVSQETRERVFAVAKQLGYERRAKIHEAPARPTETANVAFLVADRHFFSGEIFYSKVFAGAKQVLEQLNYHASILSISEEQFRNLELPQLLQQGNAAGVLLAGDMPGAYLGRLAKTGVPVVLIDFESADHPWMSVVNDSLYGTERAVAHLIGLGHRRIALIAGNVKHPTIKERIDGYYLALARHQIAIDPGLLFLTEDDSSVENGHLRCHDLLNSDARPTAIFCVTDPMALGAMKALHAAGIDIPGQISIAGYDNLEWGELAHPPLTTVNVHRRAMGEVAAQILFNQMLHQLPATSTASRTIIPVDLIVRQSTAPLG